MNRSPEPEGNEQAEMKQIQRLVRAYAQNRSLPVAVGLCAFAFVFLAISVPSVLGGIALRQGNATLFAICSAAVALALVATLYLSIPRWGGRRLQQLADVLYGDEGRATIAPSAPRRSSLMAGLAIIFGSCVVAHVLLMVFGFLPAGMYMQPISALYAVPFLVALNLLMRPAMGIIPLLWPALYALHALLILAGAPIVFHGVYEPLNMLLPTVGYGLLTAFVGHFYSRWALHSVRAIVGRQLEEAQLQQDGGEL